VGAADAVRVSAPGKVILFGEHFVVKGAPAIAGSIGLRVTVEAREKSSWPLLIVSRSLGMEARVEKDLRLRTGHPEIFAPFKRILEIISGQARLRPAHIVISSQIPIAAGLGSSAASAAAFARAYMEVLGINPGKELLLEVSYEAEKVVHGKPSGIDNTIVVEGGVIVYEKGRGYRRIKADMGDSTLVIADTGVKRNTGKIVASVLERYDRHPSLFKTLYTAAGLLVEEARRALETGDVERLGELMDINQGLLYAIGVSNIEIERILDAAREAGALGAKLTGAGRGGSVIALARPDTAEQVKRRMLQRAPWAAIGGFGGEGVRVESGR